MDLGQDPPGRITDAHCHIASKDHIPRSFIDGVLANLAVTFEAQGLNIPRHKLSSMYDQKMQDPLCDELVAEMAEAGISMSVLLAIDFTYAMKDCPLTVEESLLRHREVLARHAGKLEVFGGVDPRWGYDGVALFERSLTEFGFRGFKVYPPCGFSPSDPALFPFYEVCAAHGVPVLVHVGPTSPALAFDNSNPFMLDEAARRFPSVNFILAHGAVCFAEECALMCAFRPNVYLDISGYQGALRRGPESDPVRCILSRGINHKILFGTDWPLFRMQATQRTFVESLTSPQGPLAQVSDLDAALLLHGNMERVMRGRAADGRARAG